MSHKIIKFLPLVLLLILAVAMPALAQPPADPSPSGGVPIDGGVSLLAAAGAGLGGKFLYDSRKKSRKTPKAPQ